MPSNFVKTHNLCDMLRMYRETHMLTNTPRTRYPKYR